MKRTFELGKIDFNGTGKLRNPVTIKMSFVEGNFSIMGFVWNGTKSSAIIAGQVLDEMKPFLEDDPLFNDLYYLWKNYHLNHMKSGTPEQENAVDEWVNRGNKYNYTLACEHLKDIDLYEVMYKGELYKYGHAWLTQEIPEKDVELINKLFASK